MDVTYPHVNRQITVKLFGRFLTFMCGDYQWLEGKRLSIGTNERGDRWVRFALLGWFVYMDWIHRFTKEEIDQAKNESVRWRELFEDEQ